MRRATGTNRQTSGPPASAGGFFYSLPSPFLWLRCFLPLVLFPSYSGVEHLPDLDRAELFGRVKKESLDNSLLDAATILTPLREFRRNLIVHTNLFSRDGHNSIFCALQD